MIQRVRTFLRGLAVVLLTLVAVKNLVFALPFRWSRQVEVAYEITFDPYYVALRRVVSFLLGLVMLFLVRRLWKRVRMAWVIEVGALTTILVIRLLRSSHFRMPIIIIIEAILLVILLVTHNDYHRKAERISFQRAGLLVGAIFAIVLGNSTIGMYMMRGHWEQESKGLLGAFGDSLVMLIGWSPPAVPINALGETYLLFLRIVSWLCLAAAIALLVKPAVFSPNITVADQARVRELVLKYGQNPLAYLALEPDKKYFFSTRCEGFCAYTIANEVFVICGDVVCADEDAPILIDEIRQYCQWNAYRILMINITDRFRDAYEQAGFKTVKMGEDACFDLTQFTLSGPKIQKVRAAINFATRAGITVTEYKPLESRDEQVEEQISDITKEWLKSKGGYEMHFSVGSVSLKNPLDRRYFYAADEAGQILGYVVFVPYNDGYLADVTRRRSTAPQGVLEKTVCESFLKLKQEGVGWANLGLSPLYNLTESSQVEPRGSRFAEKLMNYVYNNLNGVYGFKQLHHAKRKFNPSDWTPRFLAYHPRSFATQTALALVKSQMKTPLTKILLAQLPSRSKKELAVQAN
ncbi:MAG: DUF2156 domain-containing protein [Propionibacteriaceae bacterium]|jgi:phosphatidylglycerol lysyltransferase|nr:DUF2156 domain-containing protein [Propionibacteriaceae bacterium]